MIGLTIIVIGVLLIGEGLWWTETMAKAGALAPRPTMVTAYVGGAVTIILVQTAMRYM